MKEENSTERQKPKPSPPHNNYLKYSGLAFQMLATFLVAFWGGQALDRYWELSFPIATIILLFVAVIGLVIMLIKNLPQN